MMPERTLENAHRSDRSPELGATRRDRFVATLRGIAGAAPVVGPALVELINEVIPNQRLERIESYLRKLADRLDGAEPEAIARTMSQPESIDLFEDGAFQAARVLSEERREQIVRLVADGISGERRDYLESKRVLRILEQLDDAEVVMLASYLHKNQDSDYWARHADVLEGPSAHLSSGQEEIDRDTVIEAGTLHLLQLGLLESGHVGRTKTANLSSLGRLLLRRLGLAENKDW